MYQPDPDSMRPRLTRIRKRWHENHDTFTMELEPTNGDGSPDFLPGQFNMLYVYGVGEIPISISGPAGSPESLIHTTRSVGLVTQAMDRLEAGAVVGVRGPFGKHWPLAEAENKDVVLVAGGIGLAPLRPAIYHLLQNRSRYGRIIILYGARTQEELLYCEELVIWRGRFDVELFVTVDRATGGWQGRVGLVTELIPRAPLDPANSLAMVCGPEIMMRFTVQALEKRGLAQDQIYISMERNMKCAIGHCGHCQLGPFFVCRDGPVFRFDAIAPYFIIQEL